MNVRTMVGALVATPALLVALVQPAEAATPGVLAFRGEITLTPTVAGQGQTEFCFFTLAESCANGAQSKGVAAGAGAGALPEVVDGIQGDAAYVESCAGELGVAATGTATITANVHRALQGWSAPVTAQWFRAGLVAVVQGDATGAAVFAPMGAPLCGTTFTAEVVGAVELAY